VVACCQTVRPHSSAFCVYASLAPRFFLQRTIPLARSSPSLRASRDPKPLASGSPTAGHHALGPRTTTPTSFSRSLISRGEDMRDPFPTRRSQSNKNPEPFAQSPHLNLVEAPDVSFPSHRRPVTLGEPLHAALMWFLSRQHTPLERPSRRSFGFRPTSKEQTSRFMPETCSTSPKLILHRIQQIRPPSPYILLPQVLVAN
jgi:hypothetical protein